MMNDGSLAPGLSFEQLTKAMRESICVSDPRQPDNPLIYVNAGFLKMTGYSRDEVLGRNCRFLQGPGTDPAALACIRELIEKRQEAEVELLNYRKDGTPFWNSLSLNPVFDGKGELIYYIGGQMDISERRMREDKARVFIENLWHELKTPLAAQIAIVETLLTQAELKDEKRRHLYDRLRHKTIGLHNSVEDILRFASINSDKLPGERRVVDFRAAIKPVLEAVESLAELAQIRLETEIPQEPLPVEADEGEIAVLVMNLLSNAINYNKAGGRASLRLRNEEDAVLLEVSDSGIGIAPEHQQRIFERFYRVDVLRSKERGGTGLGLAIVQEIVQSHGGEINVKSSPGEGSTFIVRLPRAQG